MMYIEKAIMALQHDIKSLKQGIESVNALIVEKEKMIENLKEQAKVIKKN